MADRADVLAIGECMVELAVRADGAYDRGFAGDVFNTSIYLARLGVAVDFASAVGDDDLSDGIVALARREGVGVATIARRPGRRPGLYMVHLDAGGERRFAYWRSESAARAMIAGADGAALLASFPRYRWLYLTSITLSILPLDDRLRLLAAIAAARAAGTRVAFDTNYRPSGWSDPAEARAAIVAMIAYADLFMPSAEELVMLDLHSVQGETVVKHGRRGSMAGTTFVDAVAARAVDTTSAGDSFNAAYLAARLAGHGPVPAARAGNRLAAAVIAHRGAIIPAGATPRLADLLRPSSPETHRSSPSG